MEQNSVGTKSSDMPQTSHSNNNQLPSSKLELIEKFLTTTKSCQISATTPIGKYTKSTGNQNLHSSSGIINTTTPNAVLNTHNYCNKILNNLVLFDEPKIFSLQRSISDKLRNSFKNHTKDSVANLSNITEKDSHVMIPIRKWHSERGRPSNYVTKPASSRFSTQVPLTNQYKDILAQYVKPPPTNNNNNNKINNKISQLNKKFGLLSTNKKTKCTLYDFIKQDDDDDDDSSDLSSSSNSSDTDNKTKRRMNHRDTDTDSDSLDEATNFDYNSRMDHIQDTLDLVKYDFDNNGDCPEKTECPVCCEDEYLNKRACCGFMACNVCINMYLQTQIKKSCGSIRIECLNSECTKLFHKDEISERMGMFDREALKVYLKFLVDANKDSYCKTCPRCSHIMTITNLKPKLKVTKVQCSECHLVWCFQCHAPWHNEITCQSFRKGDQMLKLWANEFHYGQQNAQLCPKCKIYIQRTKGCEHMVCMFCQTNFCYKCGRKFRHMKFIGDHYNRLSVLGCKYRFYPEKPAKRRIIRGSILCGKVLATPVVATLAAVLGVGALAVGVVALPAYGSYRLVKHIHNNHHSRKPFVHVNNNKQIEDVINKVEMAKINNGSGELIVGENLITTELNLIPREATTEPRRKEI